MKSYLPFCMLLCAMIGSVCAAEPASPDEETDDPSKLRFVAPDGRYGLLVTRGNDDSPQDRVELIEVATKRSLMLLSDPERPERSDKARLDWSADSQRVAAYIATKVDGFTQIFVRERGGFVEVELPDLPELPDLESSDAPIRKKYKFKFLKWLNTGSLKFVRWLPSGDVELKSCNEIVTTDGRTFGVDINSIIAIDSKHHATIKKTERTERFQ